MEYDGRDINMGRPGTVYIVLPQPLNGMHHVLTMLEATNRWLEICPVPHATEHHPGP